MLPKFRVWDKHKKQMIEWIDLDLSKDSGEDDITVFEPTGIVRGAFLMPILLQSTGLKDKHGVEIFEGDVLEIPVAIDTETLNGEVVFEDGIFGIKDVLDGWGFDIGLVPLIEIILAKKVIIVGNIYEHPHLLEGDTE